MMNFMKNQDIYGRAIGVHYDGKDTLKTRLGGFVTIVTKVLVLVSTINIITQFVDKSAQKEGSSFKKEDTLDMELQPLKENGFNFVLAEANPIPESIGRWKAYQWSTNYLTPPQELSFGSEHCKSLSAFEEFWLPRLG